MPSTNSPLRYPGGKSQLSKFIARTLELNHLEHSTYCEAFCGGAGVAMTLLFKNKVDRVILNDLDPAIYSIWYSILHHPDRFIERIRGTPITMETWLHQRNVYDQVKDSHGYNFDLSFAAFFLNRTNRSGIVEGGPIGGHAQDGKYKIDCRFNKDTLIQKIRSIHTLQDRIALYNYDGLEFIHRVIEPLQEPYFIFFDPPYFNQGKNLYKNALDEAYHETLAQAIQCLRNSHWIVTYDDVETIRELYADCAGWKYDIHYTANTKRRESELLFKSPITQLDSFERVSLQNL